MASFNGEFYCCHDWRGTGVSDESILGLGENEFTFGSRRNIAILDL